MSSKTLHGNRLVDDSVLETALAAAVRTKLNTLGAPEWTPGAYPAGTLAYYQGVTYRSRGIASSTAAPGTYGNWSQFWDRLGYDDTALQASLAGKQNTLTAGSIVEQLLSAAVQTKLNAFTREAVYALLEAGPGISISLTNTGKILISATGGTTPPTEPVDTSDIYTAAYDTAAKALDANNLFGSVAALTKRVNNLPYE